MIFSSLYLIFFKAYFYETNEVMIFDKEDGQKQPEGFGSHLVCATVPKGGIRWPAFFPSLLWFCCSEWLIGSQWSQRIECLELLGKEVSTLKKWTIGVWLLSLQKTCKSLLNLCLFFFNLLPHDSSCSVILIPQGCAEWEVVERLSPPESGLSSTLYIALLVCFILGASGSTQRKMKGGRISPTHLYASQSGWLCGNLVSNGGLPGPAPSSGVQCVQVQLLQVRAIEWGGDRPQR